MHRFVVEASVEENVHRLCAARAAAMDLSAAGVSKRSKNEEKMLSVRCAIRAPPCSCCSLFRAGFPLKFSMQHGGPTCSRPNWQHAD